MHRPADPTRLTPRQRWLAAQRLAAGSGVEEAAGFADVEPEAIEALAGDQRFQAQIAAEAAKLALPDAAWAEHIRAMTRQAIEVALADGRVSTVNVLLRASLVLPELAAASATRTAAALAAPAESDDRDHRQHHHQLRPSAEPDTDATTAAAAPAPSPVDADPAEEARRLGLLARAKPVPRRGLARAPLALLEQFTAATDPDPTAYEAWFAAQAKPEPSPRAPPAAGDARGTAAGLRARVLDREAARLPDELDLAGAICAVKWPKWPAYRGPVGTGLLRRVLRDVPVDPEALHRLGSTELVEACRTAHDAPIMAQGP